MLATGRGVSLGDGMESHQSELQQGGKGGTVAMRTFEPKPTFSHTSAGTPRYLVLCREVRECN